MQMAEHPAGRQISEHPNAKRPQQQRIASKVGGFRDAHVNMYTDRGYPVTQSQSYWPTTRAPPVSTQPLEKPPELHPKVILVAGYSKMGKTTVANEIAQRFHYAYVNVKNENPHSTCIDLVNRFKPLTERIKNMDGYKGIIIDDAVDASRFDPYYIDFILKTANLSINAAVLFNTEPKDASDRIDLNEIDKQTHPDSFEFGVFLEEENGPDSIILVDSTLSIQHMIEDAVQQLKEWDSKPVTALNLPVVNFIPNAPMVNDPDLVEKVIKAEADALGTTTCEYFYCFPYVLPNFILEYSLFARMSLLLKTYLIIPWIWAEKVSIIGYDGSVYIHLPSYQLLFNLDKASPALQDLCKDMKLPPKEDMEKSLLTFSLEAVMKDNKLYVSDMMYLANEFGSEKILRDRVKLMKEYLKKIPDPIVLLEHYMVSDIKKCINTYKDIASGVLFINPDGMLPGKYDSRNFVLHVGEQKKIPLRLWNGVEDKDSWTFDVYALDNSDEKQVEKSKVSIPKLEVDENSLNDGHIVECVPGWDETHPPKKQKIYKFVSRCPWQVKPATLYYLEAIVKQKDNPDVFVRSCSSIKCDVPV